MVNLELAYRMGALFDQKITSQYRASFSGDFGKVQIDVLSWLYEHPGIQAAELVERMNTPKQHISKIVAQFEKSGWIQKEPNPTDRRAALLSLTSQGKTFIEEHIRISDEKLLKMMSGISESEAERFNMALKTIIEMLEKE